MAPLKAYIHVFCSSFYPITAACVGFRGGPFYSFELLLESCGLNDCLGGKWKPTCPLRSAFAQMLTIKAAYCKCAWYQIYVPLWTHHMTCTLNACCVFFCHHIPRGYLSHLENIFLSDMKIIIHVVKMQKESQLSGLWPFFLKVNCGAPLVCY